MSIIILLVFVTGIALGLYAGKSRAAGEGWGLITWRLISDVASLFATVFKKLSAPFKKGDRGKHPDAIDVDVKEEK